MIREIPKQDFLKISMVFFVLFYAMFFFVLCGPCLIHYFLALLFILIFYRAAYKAIKEKIEGKEPLKEYKRPEVKDIVLTRFQSTILFLILFLLIFGSLFLWVASTEKEKINLRNMCAIDKEGNRSLCMHNCIDLCRDMEFWFDGFNYKYKEGCPSCQCECKRLNLDSIPDKFSWSVERVKKDAILGLDYRYVIFDNATHVNISWKMERESMSSLGPHYDISNPKCRVDECRSNYALIQVSPKADLSFSDPFYIHVSGEKRYRTEKYSVPLKYSFWGLNTPPHPVIAADINGHKVNSDSKKNRILLDEDSKVKMRFWSESYDPDGEIVEYDWILSGNKISNQSSFEIEYTGVIDTSIVLKVTDNKNSTYTTAVPIVIFQKKPAPEGKMRIILFAGLMIAFISFFIGMNYFNKFIEMKKSASEYSTRWTRPLLRAAIWGLMIPFTVIMISVQIALRKKSPPAALLSMSNPASGVERTSLGIQIFLLVLFLIAIVLFIGLIFKWRQGKFDKIKEFIKRILRKLFRKKKD
ncbi:hypothetical protein ACFL96_02960 [Thermoproteota archaeon]